MYIAPAGTLRLDRTGVEEHVTTWGNVVKCVKIWQDIQFQNLEGPHLLYSRPGPSIIRTPLVTKSIQAIRIIEYSVICFQWE